MKILHTSDWHLGKKLYDKDLQPLHQKFLDWLLREIKKQKIELLIVAGDIFDTGNPSNETRKIYYTFLTNLLNTDCKNVVIIGGNHDSPSQLDAPKEILELLNIYVIGGTPEKLEDEIIEIKNENDRLKVVVCAVPFLREKDVNYAKGGENESQREQRVKDAIRTHYEGLKDLVLQKKYAQNIPILATGHLFAQGVRTSDSEKDIYIGNLGKIGAEEFPKEFDYVALGHLHRPQKVAGENRVRYSGSPIPLSFSEIIGNKKVLVISFDENKELLLEEIDIPRFQILEQWKDKSLEEIEMMIINFENQAEEIWIEIILDIMESHTNIMTDLRKLAKKHQKKINILSIRLTGELQAKPLAESEVGELKQLEPEAVFKKMCEEKHSKSKEESEELLTTFKELQYLLDNHLIEIK